MNKRTLGVILLVVGVIVLLVALGADVVGLGSSQAFGFKQIIGAVVGVVVAAVGGVLMAGK